MAGVYDTIDQWVDWGGYTVTIDPMRHESWIYERGGELPGHRHRVQVEKGRGYDRQDTLHLMGLLSKQDTPQLTFFQPTAEALEKLPKFPSRRNGDCDTWRGQIRDIRGTGSLPIVAQKHRDGLMDVPKGQIERQVYANKWGTSSRVFSRGGVPDHGMAC